MVEMRSEECRDFQGGTANLSQPERVYGPRRRHSEGGGFGRRAEEFMCLAQLQRRVTLRCTESKRPTVRADQYPGWTRIPQTRTLLGKKGATVQENSSLPKFLSKRAGQALERANIGWPREQADATRAHLLEEEEGGGKGPDPLTII